MLVTVIGIIRFGFSLLFGLVISVRFAGIEHTRKNRIAIGVIYAILLFTQYSFLWFFGLETTSKLYPFIIHIPIILIFSLYFKRPWLISFVSAISAYLCIQAPRWIGFLANDVFESTLADHISYMLSILLAYYLIEKYVAGSVRLLIEKSKKSTLLFGVIPLFYYIFDYITIIYPDIIYSDSKWVILFIPSIVSIFYFVFITLYYAEIQKQVDSQRERDMLDVQLRHAKSELATLRQLQECTTIYRHDMRHHISFLQGLASNCRFEDIKEYLKSVKSDIDAITPIRFCENETANLILSSFHSIAKQRNVLFSVDAKLPDIISLSDTEFCSLLSNSLENAINAAVTCSNSFVDIKLQIHKNKLLISTANPFFGEITMKNGIPQSSAKNHGFGTRSIVSIAKAHGGQTIFSIEKSIFYLKIMIPLDV